MGQKAQRPGCYIRTLSRINSTTWNTIPMNFHKAVRPTTDATSIAPLGGPLMSGFERRPQWNDPRTPSVTALNVWKAKVQQNRQYRNASINARRSRTFTDKWPLNIQGHKANRQSKESQNQEGSNGRRQQEQDNPKCPRTDHTQPKQPTTTTSNAKRKREEEDELIDPHIPLPTMRGEDKSSKEEGKAIDPTKAKTKTIKGKACNQLDEERKSPGEATSSNDKNGGCMTGEFDQGKKQVDNLKSFGGEFQEKPNRQEKSSSRCIQFNNKQRLWGSFS